MKFDIRALALAAAIAPMGAVANTNAEEDRMVINRLNATDFEVVQDRQSGPGEFWCGAATFVERRSGLSELTPIYLKRGVGPSMRIPGEKSVIFSISDAGLPPDDPKRVTLTLKDPGAMVKSVLARRFCRDAFTRSTK